MPEEIEIWKDILGYETLYQVSNLGRVKSLAGYKIISQGKLSEKKEKILKQYVADSPYLFVKLSKFGKVKNFKVHRLVAEAFIPNPENKPEVNHKKGIKQDNRENQLEWATRQEQVDHGINTGLIQQKGINHPRSNLTESQVIAIKNFSLGGSCEKIGKLFGASKSTVYNIRTGKTYKVLCG